MVSFSKLVETGEPNRHNFPVNPNVAEIFWIHQNFGAVSR